MSISAATLQSICDNVARTLLDLESAYITNPQINSPTVTTISNGQLAASNSLASRVAGIGDITSEAALAVPGLAAANNVVNWMNITTVAFYQQYGKFFVALDGLVNGLNAFLTSFTVQVHSEFANAFNYVANNATVLGLGPNLTPIAAKNIFIPSNLTLGSLAVTGSASGNFTPGSTINSTQYAPVNPILIKNTGGSTTTGTATQFLITYTNASSGSSQVTASLSGALASGASISVNITAYAVTNVAVQSGGANGDQFGFIAQSPRIVGY